MRGGRRGKRRKRTEKDRGMGREKEEGEQEGGRREKGVLSV